jgi:hypothetical protein
MALLRSVWRALGGVDAPGRRAVPAGELFHPIALGFLALLVVNDHVLKGGPAPGWLTGKLSDVAGMASFPLVVTAAVDSALWLVAMLGAPVDFTLRRWKLGAAIALTGALMIAIKLSAGAAGRVAGWLADLWGHAAIVADPTDLFALPALGIAWWIGAQELRRVPLGRIEYLRRRGRPGGLEDTGATADQAAAIEAWARGGPAEPAAAALARLRA